VSFYGTRTIIVWPVCVLVDNYATIPIILYAFLSKKLGPYGTHDSKVALSDHGANQHYRTHDLICVIGRLHKRVLSDSANKTLSDISLQDL